MHVFPGASNVTIEAVAANANDHAILVQKTPRGS